jgi:adenylyl- and sulfurtransferase ThiI
MITVEEVNAVRIYFGESMEGFASLLGIDPNYQYMIEKGRMPVTKAYFLRIKYLFVCTHGLEILATGDNVYQVDSTITNTIRSIAA